MENGEQTYAGIRFSGIEVEYWIMHFRRDDL